VFAANCLGPLDRCRGTAIGKSGVQILEVNTQLTRVPVDHGKVSEVLANDKVRRKEVFVEWRVCKG